MTTHRHPIDALDAAAATPAPLDRPSSLDEIRALEQDHVVQTYRRAQVAFVRGEGVWLYDTEGRRYLDLLSGIGVASLGHGHRS